MNQRVTGALPNVAVLDWAAIRDMVRAPSYFRHMVAHQEIGRGQSIDERVSAAVAKRQRLAARLARELRFQIPQNPARVTLNARPKHGRSADAAQARTCAQIGAATMRVD